MVQFALILNPAIASSNCHCSMCRRTSGAAFLSWMAIPLIAFEYNKGNPKKLISSSQGTRYFCQECGAL